MIITWKASKIYDDAVVLNGNGNVKTVLINISGLCLINV